jgi:chorismate synthase
MASNSIGKIFTLTSFGESHGAAIGGIIDGCPAGIEINFENIQLELNRRKPGQSKLTTSRSEDDEVQFLSGLIDGKTSGAPIGFTIQNKNQHSSDYAHLKETFRPSHADYTYTTKYGLRDYRGGGRSSARETSIRVVAGAIAKQILAQFNIEIKAFVSGVGKVDLDITNYVQSNHWIANYQENEVRCPDENISSQMSELILHTKQEGDTVGGKITCVCFGLPAGLGEPIFEKLSSQLASAMMSIQATKGFEYGLGFEASKRFGSEINDEFYAGEDGIVRTKTNNSGGIQGGISNGMPVYFTVAFKPVSTIMKTQNSLDSAGNSIQIEGKGRHDACVVPRAVPIVEAMAALSILDLFLQARTRKL